MLFSEPPGQGALCSKRGASGLSLMGDQTLPLDPPAHPNALAAKISGALALSLPSWRARAASGGDRAHSRRLGKRPAWDARVDLESLSSKSEVFDWRRTP